jgi:pyruvate/2-oxoglutarate dehydrogenase complex dihydrolipoamide dehydrogenase (E3) component
MAKTYDFVAVGGGSAGYNAARVAASLGKRVAVIDSARELGGLCILRGCMPSKTLIYSAEVLHLAHSARVFGLKVSGAQVDMKALHARKKAVIGDFARHRQAQLHSGRFDLIRGHATFEDPHTLRVGRSHRIRSRAFLIGTGSRVSVPAVPGLAESRPWTSDDVLDLDFLPQSVIVIGGGIVACELAQFLARVGSRVCQIQRSDHLLRNLSPEASDAARGALEADGVEVITGTQLIDVARNRQGYRVRFRKGTRTLTRTAKHLFNALGREPATGGLGLDAAGVRTTAAGRIITNRWQQTSQPHIYAAGDCCGPHEIVHVAILQAELAARHSAGIRRLRPVDRTPLVSVVFTDPQLASVGPSEAELRKRGVPVISASYPFGDHGKSIIMNATQGYVKVVAHAKTGRILSAELAGKDAGELIHCFTTPVSMGARVKDMLQAPWYHPTLAEVLTYPLEEIAEALSR